MLIKATSPLVSIVLPVWNGQDYLDSAISSVLSQTFANFELIVVDDNSTDKTAEILQEYIIKDSRVKLFRNDINLRLPKSLNIGFSHASGSFYTWISDDNVLHHDFLETLLNFINANGADIVYSNFNIINATGEVISTKYVGSPGHLLYTNSIGAAFLYRADVHSVLSGFSENKFMYEDYDFWFRAYSLGFVFQKSDSITYDYRQHSQSLSSRIAMPRNHIIDLYNQRDIDLREFSRYRSDAYLKLINYPKELGFIRWFIIAFQLFHRQPLPSLKMAMTKIIKRTFKIFYRLF